MHSRPRAALAAALALAVGSPVAAHALATFSASGGGRAPGALPTPDEPLAVAAWAAGCAGALLGAAVAGARRRSGAAHQPPTPSPERRYGVELAAIHVGVLLAAAALIALVIGLLAPAPTPAPATVPAAPGENVLTGADRLGLGLILGSTTVLLRLAVAAVAPIWHWATRRPAYAAPPAEQARSLAVESAWLLGIAVGAGWLLTSPDAAAAHAVALAPLVLLTPAMYDVVVAPWVQFGRHRVRSGGPTIPAELLDWIASRSRELGAPTPRLAVVPGRSIEAMTCGVPPLGRWIVLGETLVREFPPREVRAILAHELAHVARRHVRTLALVTFAATLAFVATRRAVAGLVAGALWDVGVTAVLATFWFALLPGWVARRFEFVADRDAARITGDPEALADALRRLGALHGADLERATITHPSVTERIAALRALHAAPPCPAREAARAPGA